MGFTLNLLLACYACIVEMMLASLLSYLAGSLVLCSA